MDKTGTTMSEGYDPEAQSLLLKRRPEGPQPYSSYAFEKA